MKGPCGNLRRVLAGGSAFAFFWSGGAMMSWLVLPAAAHLPIDEGTKREVSRRLVQWGFRSFHHYMRWTGLTDFDPRQLHLDVAGEPQVLIANHPTLVDVTAIMAALGDVACVVKGELFEGSAVGRLLELCGHIDGGDGNAMASAAVVTQAIDRIENGQSVLIFPEGTRSPPGALHPFSRGAFEIARRTGASVQPLIIKCDPPALAKGQPWYDVPRRRAHLEVTPLVEPLPEAGMNTKALALEYRRIYEDALGLERPSTRANENPRGNTKK